MSEQMLDLFRRRRTVRRFTSQDVTDQEVELLLEMAMYAPNRLNRQPWRFVVIRDPQLKSDLAHTLRIRPYLEEAPVVIAVCGIPNLSSTWVMDTSAAIENMLLAATAIGLGGAWVGSPDTVMWSLAEECLHDKARIPLDVPVVALVALGHPAELPEPHERSQRYDATKIHYEQWGKQRLG
ncbi:MAG: nitroreductase family protein [Anaerolineae bacterium]|nr:nitroreductase family protein [Anaerolineae bacterium]